MVCHEQFSPRIERAQGVAQGEVTITSVIRHGVGVDKCRDKRDGVADIAGPQQRQHQVGPGRQSPPGQSLTIVFFVSRPANSASDVKKAGNPEGTVDNQSFKVEAALSKPPL
ncbi:uncharacterized protein METZ01_LOCUS79981 [marine metagenome]|uniref:Uncharacterized protein n=1 Tax=marine metagenome TaxID=408172 RepID=A0A381UIF5_9ZZZZ